MGRGVGGGTQVSEVEHGDFYAAGIYSLLERINNTALTLSDSDIVHYIYDRYGDQQQGD